MLRILSWSFSTHWSLIISRVSDRSASNSSNGRTLEQAEAEAAVTVASSDSRGVTRPPLSLMDLRDALQVSHRATKVFVIWFFVSLVFVVANLVKTEAKQSHQAQRAKSDTKQLEIEAKICNRYEASRGGGGEGGREGFPPYFCCLLPLCAFSIAKYCAMLCNFPYFFRFPPPC